MSDSVETFNPRQLAFVSEYLLDLNGSAAAIRAGYSPATAGAIASELLALPKIAAAVERGKADRLERTGFKADKVLVEMSLLAHSSIEHYRIDDNGNLQLAEGAPQGAMRAVQSFTKKIRHDKDGGVSYDCSLKLWDKPQPLKLMGKHVGLFADKVEHSGPDGGPIQTVTRIERVIIDPKEPA